MVAPGGPSPRPGFLSVMALVLMSKPAGFGRVAEMEIETSASIAGTPLEEAIMSLERQSESGMICI